MICHKLSGTRLAAAAKELVSYTNSAVNLDYCRIYINFAAKIGGSMNEYKDVYRQPDTDKL